MFLKDNKGESGREVIEASREVKEDRMYALSLLPTEYSVCPSTEQAVRLRGAGKK